MVDSVRHLGARVQGRRLPVRPDGPPPEGEHARRAAGARPADAAPRRRRRQARSTSTARAGTSARWPNNARFVQATPAQHGRHRHRHVQRPAARRASAAAGRSTRTRGSRASPAGCTPTRTATPVNGTPDEQRARLLLYQDRIKVGLAGNLRDYGSSTATGATVTGAEVDYNGQPAGYTADPRRRSPTSTRTTTRRCSTRCSTSCRRPPPMADRVRMHTLALATTALGQGVVVLARRRRPAALEVAGPQQLRLRRLVQPDRLVRRTSRRGARACRRATDNEAKWAFMRPLLADPALEPAPADIRGRARAGRRAAADPVIARRCSGSGTAAAGAAAASSFPTGGPDQTPGVIVMAIDDTAGATSTGAEGVVVVFNATPDGDHPDGRRRSPGGATRCTRCRPTAPTRSSRRSPTTGGPGAFTVPARTVAVFVQR